MDDDDLFPLSRVQRIMKLDEDCPKLKVEAVQMMSYATKIFLGQLGKASALSRHTHTHTHDIKTKSVPPLGACDILRLSNKTLKYAFLNDAMEELGRVEKEAQEARRKKRDTTKPSEDNNAHTDDDETHTNTHTHTHTPSANEGDNDEQTEITETHTDTHTHTHTDTHTHTHKPSKKKLTTRGKHKPQKEDTHTHTHTHSQA
eukprot:GHVR01150894.1.p1 GENE.GHVR01150894.1~~GHVR01150894.1.p1  ORF type:complete len:202 (-),score=132.22 GHVR01150894.1:267-872(-)